MQIDPDQDYQPVNRWHRRRRERFISLVLFLLPIAVAVYVLRVPLLHLVSNVIEGQPLVANAEPDRPPNEFDVRRAQSYHRPPVAPQRTRFESRSRKRAAPPHKMPNIAHVAPQPVRQSPPQVKVRAVVFNCESAYTYGSIRYRECRAGVKKHLHQVCDRLTQNVAAIGSRPTAYDYARKEAYCAAYRNYGIVN